MLHYNKHNCGGNGVECQKIFSQLIKWSYGMKKKSRACSRQILRDSPIFYAHPVCEHLDVSICITVMWCVIFSQARWQKKLFCLDERQSHGAMREEVWCGRRKQADLLSQAHMWPQGWKSTAAFLSEQTTHSSICRWEKKRRVNYGTWEYMQAQWN